jgi:hypothetical protein
MKDSIVLQGRTYECTKLVQQRFGLDNQTLRKWVKSNIVRNCSPPSRAEAITSAMPTDPVAGERVGRHGAIEPSG